MGTDPTTTDGTDGEAGSGGVHPFGDDQGREQLNGTPTSSLGSNSRGSEDETVPTKQLDNMDLDSTSTPQEP